MPDNDVQTSVCIKDINNLLGKLENNVCFQIFSSVAKCSLPSAVHANCARVGRVKQISAFASSIFSFVIVPFFSTMLKCHTLNVTFLGLLQLVQKCLSKTVIKLVSWFSEYGR